jgi:hypothetical protein
MGGISTIVQNHIGLPVLGRDASIDTPPEILFRLATPGEDGEPCQQQKEPIRANPSFSRAKNGNYQLRPKLRPPRSGRQFSQNGVDLL